MIVDKKVLVMPLLNKDGKRLGEAKLEIPAFKPINLEATGYQAIKALLASRRSGTASTKTRGEIRGGGQKPWRQKGTGRARVGSIRAPHWTGGGTVFGPKPRDFGFEIPKKMKKKALAQALINRIEQQSALVLKNLNIKEGKTSEALKLLDGLKINNKALVVLGSDSDIEARAFRNLKSIKAIQPEEMNLYDLYWCNKIIIKEEALEAIKRMIAA